MVTVEHHPLQPFLPTAATVLMLGSFPPGRERWSMEFFYPNFQNDMWRIMGLIFFGDKNYFIVDGEKRFAYDMIVAFCEQTGIAIFDTAQSVRRLSGNASDKFLEIIEPTNIVSLIDRMPYCRAIVTTGQKATDVVCEQMQCDAPTVGTSIGINVAGRTLQLYRMPSSSRAYPMSVDKKADIYRTMYVDLGLL